MLIHGDLTESIIGAAIEVHRVLGPGLLESIYEAAMCVEIRLRGLKVERQVPLEVTYKGHLLDPNFRVDLVVERTVVVELRCALQLIPVHEAALLTYMRLTRLRVGLLFNFHAPVLKEGIIRRVL